MGEYTPQIRFKGFTDDWEERKLGELARILTGFPFKNENFVSDGKYLVITNGNIQNNSSVVDALLGNRIDDISDEIKERYYLNKDDILVTMDGTVGRTAKVADDNLILAQRVGRLVSNINSEFLYQWLNRGSFFDEMTKVSHGGTIKHISLNEISRYSSTVPINNMEQQKIGSFFTQIDNTISLHQRQLDLLKEQKAGFLQKMFPKQGAKVPELRFAGFTDEWEERKLGEMATSFEYGLNASSKEFDGVHKYIRITDIDDSSRKFKFDSITTPDIDFSFADNFKLKKGDILFARTGASVGKTYVYNELDGLVYYAGFLIRMRVNTDFDEHFIFQNTLTHSYLNFIRITSQRSGQPGVNSQEYASFTIMVPCFEEQEKIGAFFKSLDTTITLQQRKLDLLKEQKKALLQKMFV